MANLMNHDSDNRIEVFRQTVERLGMLMGQLQTLEVTLARAKELPDLIALASHPIQREFLKEEQAIIGHPAGLLIRCLQLDRELRQGWLVANEQLTAAMEAVTVQLATVAGVVKTCPLARSHLREFAQHRNMPATASIVARLSFLRRAWLTVDAAVASLGEITDDRQRKNLI